ncbi:MAG: SIR2 family protein [Roseibium sp.]
MVPFSALASLIRDREAVFFAGSAASVAGVPDNEKLPLGSELSRLIALETSYPGSDTSNLSKVAQYADEVSVGRRYLLKFLEAKFFSKLNQDYESAFGQFLKSIDAEHIPKLIVTTNYDCLIERALESRGIPYLAFGHLKAGTKGGRLFCCDSLSEQENGLRRLTRAKLDDLIEDRMLEDRPPVLIYKMHGTAAHLFEGSGELTCDPVVLTENDYIDFLAANLIHEIPTDVLTILRQSTLMFFGYALEDWNFRVLLSQIKGWQQIGIKNWACLLEVDEVEEAFWKERDVNIAKLDVAEFLDLIQAEL